MKDIWPVHVGMSTCEPSAVSDAGSALEVVVIYTDIDQTLQALRTAAKLARDLSARLHLLVPEIVPFPAPLDQPLVDRNFAERRIRTIVKDPMIDTAVELCLCRERETAVLGALRPRSLVVVGSAKSWWRSRRERRLVRALRGEGHHVITVQSE